MWMVWYEIMVGPCKGFKDRHIACHANCSLYIEYAKEMERIRQNRAKHQQQYGITSTKLQKSYRAMNKFNFHKGDVDK